MSFACSGATRARSRTITDQFHAFHAQHPHVYRALERMTARQLATGATRVGLKNLFEDLRRELPYGVAGLNNNFTALYARQLVAAHPKWASAFELRRRRAD
ncbi:MULTISPECIES: hypothetical protein [Streptomyces]|uniref:Uncharacterized protein n=1 Tax=Streptomyces finlayi TaxID=67296 RepID=A0A7G7BGQ2_9ACTN|nr:MULTISPECIES: hypothetical protein [Streptomyces]MDJ0464666.1 hypothetical protein [Streptomyces sp. H27-C3]QNE74517.1 hypothetical protein F0344_07745 [Streptomyces finlayi]